MKCFAVICIYKSHVFTDFKSPIMWHVYLHWRNNSDWKLGRAEEFRWKRPTVIIESNSLVPCAGPGREGFAAPSSHAALWSALATRTVLIQHWHFALVEQHWHSINSTAPKASRPGVGKRWGGDIAGALTSTEGISHIVWCHTRSDRSWKGKKGSSH